MSASGADLALQTAMFNILTTTTAVTDLLADGANSVFDAPPDNADFPFIVIGDNELNRGPLKTCERWQGKATVNVRTRQGKGPGTPPPPVEQAKRVLEQAQEVLTDNLILTGYDVIVFTVDFLGTDVDPSDQKSVQGRLTYEFDIFEMGV